MSTDLMEDEATDLIGELELEEGDGKDSVVLMSLWKRKYFQRWLF